MQRRPTLSIVMWLQSGVRAQISRHSRSECRCCSSHLPSALGSLESVLKMHSPPVAWTPTVHVKPRPFALLRMFAASARLCCLAPRPWCFPAPCLPNPATKGSADTTRTSLTTICDCIENGRLCSHKTQPRERPALLTQNHNPGPKSHTDSAHEGDAPKFRCGYKDRRSCK